MEDRLAPRNSRKKLEDLIQGAAGADEVASDPEAGQALGILRMVAPVAMGLVPTDPDELDALLLHGAQMALQMRSDDADPPSSLLELMGAEEVYEGDAEEVPYADAHGIPEWDDDPR